METTTERLLKCQKGEQITIDGQQEFVLGQATVYPMGRRKGEGPFIVIPNSPAIRLVWTRDTLLFHGPRYEKGPEIWMIFRRGDLAGINYQELMQFAGVFGSEMHQQQQTVSMKIEGQTYWFSDVGTAGSGDVSKENEGEVIVGPACLRFYHLTTSWQDGNAFHVMHIGSQPQENEFSNQRGFVYETLWINGKIVDVEDESVVAFSE